MCIFNRLFGSKKNNNEPDNNQQKLLRKPELENPENKIKQNPDTNLTIP